MSPPERKRNVNTTKNDGNQRKTREKIWKCQANAKGEAKPSPEKRITYFEVVFCVLKLSNLIVHVYYSFPTKSKARKKRYDILIEYLTYA